MRSMLRALLIVSAILTLTLQALAVPSPKEQVRQTVDQVLEVLRNKALTGQPRREILSRLIQARFDFAIMSQRTLGPYWRQASPPERDRFVMLFTELLETSYIGRIEAYSDETVSYAGEQIDGDLAEVDTRIHNGKTVIPISYRLVLVDGQWFVYDVIIEAVSLIKNYRNSYGEIVRREGFPGLFARMEEKIVELRKSPGAGKAGEN